MQNVLIVDDQQIPRMILTQFVETIGPDVTGKPFETPATALGWAKRHPVAMALVDYRMPGMDGIAFTRQLHALPGKRDVPVVIFTALDDPDKAIRYEALSAGAVDFLPKPVDYTEWRFRCRNLLNLALDLLLQVLLRHGLDRQQRPFAAHALALARHLA